MDKKEFIQQYVLQHGGEENVVNTAECLANELCEKKIIDNDNGDGVNNESIDFMFLGSRVVGLLLKLKIRTVGDLVSYGRKNILSRAGIGKQSIHELDEYLNKFGIIHW